MARTPSWPDWFRLEQEDSINVGDVFDWQPYGTEGWPRASEYAVVVCRITYPDENAESGLDELRSTGDLCVDDDPSEVKIWTLKLDGSVHWNELPHFRDMARRAK